MKPVRGRALIDWSQIAMLFEPTPMPIRRWSRKSPSHPPISMMARQGLMLWPTIQTTCLPIAPIAVFGLCSASAVTKTYVHARRHEVDLSFMFLGIFTLGKWWAWQGLNLRPLRCQHIAYRCFAQKSAVFRFLRPRTSGEQTGFLEQVYRRFTAPLSPSDGGLNG